MKELITIPQYFNAQARAVEVDSNARELLVKVNSLLQEFGIEKVKMTSGYRSPEYNAKVGGAKGSKHCFGQAIDLADNDRKLGNLCLANLDKLRARGMAMEALDYCIMKNGNKWVHLQSCLPKSGNVVFIPYAGPVIYR